MTKIISEIGWNHMGGMVLAKEMIHASKENGADIVKFQTFNADRLICKDTRKVSYQIKNDAKERSQYEMLSDLMLSDEEFITIKKACKKPFVIPSILFFIKK